MKKIIFGTIMMSLLLFSSCIKSPLNTLHIGQVGGGTWAFAGVIDTATSCSYDTTFEAMSASNYKSGNFTNYTTIRCGYKNRLVSGTYTVVPTTVVMAPYQINFEIDYGLGGTNGNSFYSLGTGANQTVNVSVSGNKVTIIGSGINIYCPVNHPTPADTSVLTLNLYAPY